jgi:hypothetical protein
MALDGASLGLPVETVFVDAPAVDDAGPADTQGGRTVDDRSGQARYASVQSFVEALVARGRVAVASSVMDRRAPAKPPAGPRLTHQLVRVDAGVELRRVTFECWCGG